jgi:hypothetical protein
VLKEVSETILMILLLVCTSVGSDPELSALSWLVIVADVVLQTILELTCSDSRVIRKGSLTEGHSCSNHGCNKKK